MTTHSIAISRPAIVGGQVIFSLAMPRPGDITVSSPAELDAWLTEAAAEKDLHPHRGANAAVDATDPVAPLADRLLKAAGFTATILKTEHWDITIYDRDE